MGTSTHSPNADTLIDTRQADKTVCAAGTILENLGGWEGQYAHGIETAAEHFYPDVPHTIPSKMNAFIFLNDP